MSVKQISVFLENRAGALSELTGAVSRHTINMRALSLAETSDFGIARIIVDDVDKTTAVLREEGFIHSVSTVLAVRIPNVPGGLDRVLRVLGRENVNIEYMYAFLGASRENACMVFKVADPDRAHAALISAAIVPLDQAALTEM